MPPEIASRPEDTLQIPLASRQDVVVSNNDISAAPIQSSVKKFKKRGRQIEDEGRITKISTSGWIETVTFMPVSECPPACPDCPAPSLSPPEV
jgi:hypothetical protein